MITLEALIFRGLNKYNLHDHKFGNNSILRESQMLIGTSRPLNCGEIKIAILSLGLGSSILGFFVIICNAR